MTSKDLLAVARERGMNQKDVAQLLGVGRPFVCQVASEAKKFSAYHVAILCRKLGIDPDIALEDSYQGTDEIRINLTGMPPETRSIIVAMAKTAIREICARRVAA